MYSFPFSRPATGSNMNYVSAVYAILGVVMAVDWFVRGRREFVVRRKDVEESTIRLLEWHVLWLCKISKDVLLRMTLIEASHMQVSGRI